MNKKLNCYFLMKYLEKVRKFYFFPQENPAAPSLGFFQAKFFVQYAWGFLSFDYRFFWSKFAV